MRIGNASAWRSGFKRLDERLMERILAIWPECMSVFSEQPTEDAITFNLVDRLFKDEQVRRMCNWIEFQFEPSGVKPNGEKYSKGKIDMAVFQSQDRDRYLAYECKRLNVINSGSRSSLATDYVKDGVSRFITEQYAEGLDFGSMLGYVMDSDLSFSKEKINAAMIEKKDTIHLIEGPKDGNEIDSIARFNSKHNRPISGKIIELRHTLIPMNYAKDEI